VVARAAATEAARRLDPGVVDALSDAGLFHMLMPESLGGLGLPMHDALLVLETISAADGSTGWCLLKGAASSMMAGYLPADVAAEVQPDRSTRVAGNFNPGRGTARPVDGGFVLSGRWDWATGVHHASWFIAGALAQGETPHPIALWVPTSSLDVLDTWHSPGMTGTGSTDVVATEVFVPERFAFAGMMAAPQVADPLYAVPYGAQVMVPHGALAIGIAQGAIEAFIALAGDKTPLNATGALAGRPTAQDALGRALGAVRSARAYLYAAVAAAWTPVDAPDPATWLDLSLACTQATSLSLEAVDALHAAAGGTVAQGAHPIARAFRDLHVAASHYTVSTERFAGAGRVALGLAPSPLA
jgi:alkylation response protein AidB-like acyl-CoA dehydrogenase